MTELAKIVTRTLNLFRQQAVAQVGALCFRLDGDGMPLVLLITSRDTKRWVIPKGNVEPGEKANRAAEREAFEEAGIKGRAERKPVGSFTYRKDEKGICRVEVYALSVKAVVKKFPESGERESVWLSCDEAALRVAEPNLKNVIRMFGMGYQKALYDRK